MEASGRKKKKREEWERGGGGGGGAVERRKYGKVEKWSTEGPCCPPMKMFSFGQWLMAGAASQGRGHTVSLSLRRETQSSSGRPAQRCDQLALGGDLWGLWTMLSRRLKLPLAQVSCRLRTCSGGLFSVLLRRRRALFPWTWEENGGNDAECKFWLPGLASAVNYAAIPAGRRSDWRQRSGSSWGEGLIPCLFMQVCSRSTRFRSFLLYLPLPRELLGHWCEKPPEWTESMLVKPLWAPPGWLTDLITSYTVTILTDV